MGLPGIREGAGIRVAAKFQTAQGTPIDTWVDEDLLRADDAPAPDPQIEIIAQTGSHGSPYERDEGVRVVGITPTINMTIKANPKSVKLFVESLLGVTGSVIGPGPGGGTIEEFEGFVIGIPKLFTYIWDTTIETIKAFDCWAHTIEWNSEGSENLVMTVDAEGFNFPPRITTPELTTQDQISFDTYAHKESVIEDVIGGTPIPVWSASQNIKIEQARNSQRGNLVAPNLICKDGRIAVTGSFVTRLYDDTIIFFDRILSTPLGRANLNFKYVQQDGKILDFILRNCTFEGTVLPGLGGDGTLENFTVNWTARQKAGVFPIAIQVEE